jgi:hypothetical protein
MFAPAKNSQEQGAKMLESWLTCVIAPKSSSGRMQVIAPPGFRDAKQRAA